MRQRLGLALAFLLTFALQTNASEECLTFVMGGGSPELRAVGERISNELARNDICNSLHFAPSKRATWEFLHGKVDGEIGRIQFYSDVVLTQGVKIPTPVFTYSGHMMTKSSKITSLADIKQSIGVVRGWVWMQKVAEWLPKVEKIQVSTIESLVQMLETDRLEVILIPSETIQRLKLENKYHHYKVIDLHLHIWLNAKKIKHLEKIDQILSEYIQSGKSFQ